ncbi:hypothetical protein GH714_006601 [Hevea brasiliensis]|uniref:Uncharacterized protein n=1 Tax=Hevea brasiliensis TaxID=3981 RepID=A0A6A6NB59_HEVBR|nr:hypothetical protein GH714_006601 [Hevea brasiliensis]
MSPGQPLQLSHSYWQDNYGSGYRSNCDYWNARRAFLSSYHFKEKSGFKINLKSNMKELGEAAMGVAMDIRKEISERRLGIRVFRFTFALPSFVLRYGGDMRANPYERLATVYQEKSVDEYIDVFVARASQVEGTTDQ